MRERERAGEKGEGGAEGAGVDGLRKGRRER